MNASPTLCRGLVGVLAQALVCDLADLLPQLAFDEVTRINKLTVVMTLGKTADPQQSSPRYPDLILSRHNHQGFLSMGCQNLAAVNSPDSSRSKPSRRSPWRRCSEASPSKHSSMRASRIGSASERGPLPVAQIGFDGAIFKTTLCHNLNMKHGGTFKPAGGKHVPKSQQSERHCSWMWAPIKIIGRFQPAH